MKKTITNIFTILCFSILLSSCYTLTYNVGNGPQTGVEVKEKNHYLLYGLAPLTTTDPQAMAGDTDNYQVSIQHSFVDGLINAITFGIYAPTTTTVTK